MQNKYIKFLFLILVIAFIVPQITLAVWWNPFSWGFWNSLFHRQTPTTQTQQSIVGGDKDAHGCIGSAGYTWCEAKNKCLRAWEEKCEAATTDPTAGWKTYINAQYGFEFKYPSILLQSVNGEDVVLSHSINHTHPDVCDFKGDASPREKLVDFDVSFKIIDKNLKEYIQSSNFPGWDYVSKNPFSSGSLAGYKIEEGLEGCGNYIYYFPVSSNKTLIVTRSIITEFTPIISEYKTYISLPGVIIPSQEENYLNHIFSTFKFTTPVGPTASWKTYTNAQYGFQLTLPESWEGYTVETSSWQGQAIDNSNQKYSGPGFVFTNPQGPNNHIFVGENDTTPSCWQNIPIIIFTHEQWGPDSGNDKIGTQRPIGIIISAAPVGAGKIGENSKYVFALPPRWAGFVCDLGMQEAYDIVKTFKIIN